ncbi:Uncharacterised protein [Stutzerimonas stutzeri]|nr:hypothetical protein CXK90_00640 [Stutzerimonas stutzeri]VEI35752.1 Uncharacterised protein [Stutzerimonas stutzeri]
MPASNGVAANTVLGGARGNLMPFINYLQAAPLLALRDFFVAHATQSHVLTQINGIGTCAPVFWPGRDATSMVRCAG